MNLSSVWFCIKQNQWNHRKPPRCLTRAYQNIYMNNVLSILDQLAIKGTAILQLISLCEKLL